MTPSIIPIIIAIISSLTIAYDIKKHPQPSKTVDTIWIASALWSSLFGLILYFWIGRKQETTEPHYTLMRNRPVWKKVIVSTYHCGAGCTFADLLGAAFLALFPITAIVSSISGRWTFNYILSLLFGLYFQYNTIKLGKDIPKSKIFTKAVIVNLCSLTIWKSGVYTWLYIAIYKLHLIESYSLDSWGFWFILQQAMFVGFILALPVNYLLVMFKIKG